MAFSRQAYCSELPFPTRGLPDPGIKPISLASPALQADSLPLAPPHTSDLIKLKMDQRLKRAEAFKKVRGERRAGQVTFMN